MSPKSSDWSLSSASNGSFAPSSKIVKSVEMGFPPLSSSLRGDEAWVTLMQHPYWYPNGEFAKNIELLVHYGDYCLTTEYERGFVSFFTLIFFLSRHTEQWGEVLLLRIQPPSFSLPHPFLFLFLFSLPCRETDSLNAN